MLKLRDGFSVIEALIAVAILSIAVIGLVTTIGTFSSTTVDRTVLNCLVDAASTALYKCQAGVDSNPNSTCGGSTISIAGTSGYCAPATGTCTTVTAVATASPQGKTVSLTTQICNFN
ncbi:MAG: prepilin-type N-terminal cleavage/methylation domain-containing protein [Alphaproteobacteria bacterium]|uniref:Prepilin-type N-terminal cleavage/methylation domain-containing protein n=1 Tax=Candidatus Nitrobium versatile TaxID=2884831 RepID=A0A953LXC6_9BACT|nr:prepilin-type N-terminal cleavage/methylation domain-containing protein [Candidatus Nitrobium versatile]